MLGFATSIITFHLFIVFVFLLFISVTQTYILYNSFTTILGKHIENSSMDLAKSSWLNGVVWIYWTNKNRMYSNKHFFRCWLKICPNSNCWIPGFHIIQPFTVSTHELVSFFPGKIINLYFLITISIIYFSEIPFGEWKQCPHIYIKTVFNISRRCKILFSENFVIVYILLYLF